MGVVVTGDDDDGPDVEMLSVCGGSYWAQDFKSKSIKAVFTVTMAYNLDFESQSKEKPELHMMLFGQAAKIFTLSCFKPF